MQPGFRVIPVTLKEANAFVAERHRHHAPTVSHRWSIGLAYAEKLVGVAICGRPKARMLPQYTMLEVNRLATDGTRNACSQLYSACARLAAIMGYDDIETSILITEPGTSLRAAGWAYRRNVKGRNWNTPARNGRRTDQPQCDKQVWGKKLRPTP